MSQSNDNKNLVMNVEFDANPLQEKLELLLKFNASFFKEGIDSVFFKTLDLILNRAINKSNIIITKNNVTGRTLSSNQLVCVLDLDIVNVLRECVMAMGTSDGNGSVHNNISNCRGI